MNRPASSAIAAVIATVVLAFAGAPAGFATQPPPGAGPQTAIGSDEPTTQVSPAGCSVGAGGTMPRPVDIVSVDPGGCEGYLIADAEGHVAAFGGAVLHGDLTGDHLNAPIVAIAATEDGGGYYLLAADGGVFTFGDATFRGSTGSMHLNAPVIGMATDPGTGGYWLLGADGGVFSFDAPFYGSTGGQHLNKPVVGMAVAPDGGGYWLVGSDGGVFTFTPDGFYGSAGSWHLNAPVVAMDGSPDGRGYTLVASDGGVFSFGDAPFLGSLGGHPPAAPVAGISVTPGGDGYYAIDQAGNVYAFGEAPNLGGAACKTNNAAIYGVDPDAMADTGGGTQLITVVAGHYSAIGGTLVAWTRPSGGCWTPMTFGDEPAQPYHGELGANGVSDNRQEGDETTQLGLFAFADAMYGISPTPPSPNYRYHQITCGSWWDEYPGTAQFDQFVQLPCGVTPAWSDQAEQLWTETVAYQHFAHILLPFGPGIGPEAGKAGIFLHDQVYDTAGCVALANNELNAILGWMTPAQSPHIAIGVVGNISSL